VKRPPNIAELRAAWWANGALRHARRQLTGRPLPAVTLSPPDRLPQSARRGVDVVLRLRRPSCLESALVRQSWLAAHGVRRDVVIGVVSPAEDFAAHAWVDGDGDPQASRFSELTRVVAR
jgi:hypothetical protein